MAAFAELIEAQMSGAVVRCAPLVRFDFRSGPGRYWPGFGALVAAGVTWDGTGALGTISSVSAGPGLAVEEMTFQLAAGPKILQKFSDDAEETTGREVDVFLEFFDVRQEDGFGNWVEWQPLDEPVQFFWGVMGPLKAERPEPGSDPDAARARRTLSVSAANAFINRSRPPFGFWSDRDQKARHSGDNMFINAARMANAEVRWPQGFLT